MEAKVLFFKPNGKFYAEETYKGFTEDSLPDKVFNDIKVEYAGRYAGMNMVVVFSDDYDRGYPFMELGVYR